MSKHIYSLFILFVLLISGTCFAGDTQAPDRSTALTVVEEIRRGSIDGEIGIYYELIDYDKAFYTEDDRTLPLDDGDILVPYFQINYRTPYYFGFRIGAGLTGYTHLNGSSERENTNEDFDEFVFHELYLQYGISKTSFKIGRQELEDTVFLSDYYEAFSLTSRELEKLRVTFAVVKELAESDISKFIEFQNINRGNDSLDDYLYAIEAKWDIVPGSVAATLYYYHEENLYYLYGTHGKLSHEVQGIGSGLIFDAYATEEDSRNGLRDIRDNVHDTHIFHINPYIEIRDLTLALGYIGTDHDIGAREGGVIDDFINPFNEGDKVYEPDAETWYCSLSYEVDSFSVGGVFGRTTWMSDSGTLTEEEVDIKAGLKILETFMLEAAFAIVSSESPQGDLSVLEMSVTYEF